MEKLVRDKIPEIMEASGVKCNYRIEKDDLSFSFKLWEKLMEETQEFNEACIKKGKDDTVEEAADMLTCIIAYAKNEGKIITAEEIVESYKKKLEERGAFDKKIIATINI